MRGAIPPIPQDVFMACCLVKRRDNFNRTLLNVDHFNMEMWRAFWTPPPLAAIRSWPRVTRAIPQFLVGFISFPDNVFNFPHLLVQNVLLNLFILNLIFLVPIYCWPLTYRHLHTGVVTFPTLRSPSFKIPCKGIYIDPSYMLESHLHSF
jgi:hypothetical protein